MADNAGEAQALFTITTAHLDTGLRGFPVGSCMTSKVDPIKGVSYVGYPIAELAPREPEEIAFLLLNRRLPQGDELAAFGDDLRARRGIPADVLETLKHLPKEGHPMGWLSAGLLILGMRTVTHDWVEDAKNLIARAPELCAAIYRIRSPTSCTCSAFRAWMTTLPGPA
jgi:citrate synthase